MTPMALPGSAPSSQGDSSASWSLPGSEFHWTDYEMFVKPVFNNFIAFLTLLLRFHVYMHDYLFKRGYRKAALALLAEAKIVPMIPPIDAREGLLFECVFWIGLSCSCVLNPPGRWWSVFWTIFTEKANGDGPTEEALLYVQVRLTLPFSLLAARRQVSQKEVARQAQRPQQPAGLTHGRTQPEARISFPMGGQDLQPDSIPDGLGPEQHASAASEVTDTYVGHTRSGSKGI